MNIFPTREDHHLERGKVGPETIDHEEKIEAEERRVSGIMEIIQEKHYNNGNNNMMMMNEVGVGIEVVEYEMWPVDHPMEPSDEDRPVKCPMPHSSVINVTKFSKNDEGKREKRIGESLRKRTEKVATAESFPTVRAVRKRHHTLTTGGDDRIIVIHPVPTPLLPPPPPPPKI